MIRSVTTKDCDSVSDLIYKYHELRYSFNDGTRRYFENNRSKFLNSSKKEFRDNISSIYVAIDNNNSVIGFIEIDEEDGFTYISKLYVRYMYRDEMIDEELINWIMDISKNNVIRVKCVTKDSESHRLFLKIGFETLETIRENNIEVYLMEYRKSIILFHATKSENKDGILKYSIKSGRRFSKYAGGESEEDAVYLYHINNIDIPLDIISVEGSISVFAVTINNEYDLIPDDDSTRVKKWQSSLNQIGACACIRDISPKYISYCGTFSTARDYIKWKDTIGIKMK